MFILTIHMRSAYTSSHRAIYAVTQLISHLTSWRCSPLAKASVTAVISDVLAWEWCGRTDGVCRLVSNLIIPKPHTAPKNEGAAHFNSRHQSPSTVLISAAPQNEINQAYSLWFCNRHCSSVRNRLYGHRTPTVQLVNTHAPQSFTSERMVSSLFFFIVSFP